MQLPEFVNVLYHHFRNDIKTRYGLATKVHKNGFVYIWIIRVIYGLKQATICANQIHVKNQHRVNLSCTRYASFMKHKTRYFICLYVHNVGVIFFKEDTDHL